MELRQYITIVRRWFWLILLSIIVSASASFVASKTATPLFRTKTTLMVGRVIQNPEPNSAELNTGQQLAYTYSQLAQREPVLNGVVESLGLPISWGVLANQVDATAIPQTQLIEIGVIDNDPYRAKVLADEIAHQLILQSPSGSGDTDQERVAFIQAQLDDLKSKIENAQQEGEQLRQELDATNSAIQIQELQNQINVLDTKIGNWQNTYSNLLLTFQGGDINALTVIEEASIPSQPISPNVRMNVLIASVIGLILAIGVVFIIEYLDDTIKTSTEVARITGLPVLGSISRIDGDNYPDKLVAALDPLSPIVEAFRVLNLNLQFSSPDKPPRSLMITSPGLSEGKSLSLANLAVVMAQKGLDVIAVDADMRQPTLHKIFNLSNNSGLSDLFLDVNLGISDQLLDTEIKNLHLLPSGPTPPNPAQLLESDRMKTVIDELKSQADIVLFDSPPCLLVSDSTILSTQIDGVILVIQAERTRTNDARHAVEEFQRLNVKLLGLVFNTQNQKHHNGYRYYRYEKELKTESDQNRLNVLKEKLLSFIKRDKLETESEQK